MLTKYQNCFNSWVSRSQYTFGVLKYIKDKDPEIEMKTRIMIGWKSFKYKQNHNDLHF